MTTTTPTPSPPAVLTPTTCRAAGCEKPAFGLPYCGLHVLAFEPGRERRCRMDACPGAPLAHGLCRAHYARWSRWKARVEDGSPRDIEVWLKRDWARPIGEPGLLEQANVSTRMLRSLYERLEAHCSGDETAYDRCRQVLEEYARQLPDPTPAQLKEAKRKKKRKADRRH